MQGIAGKADEVEAAREKRVAAVAAMDAEIAEKRTELAEVEEQLGDEGKRMSSARAVEQKYDAEESSVKRAIAVQKVRCFATALRL